MQNDCQQKQLQDLEWYRNSIAELVKSTFCPNGHFAEIVIETFPESGKACDAIFMCKQCGRTFSYGELIKIATSVLAEGSIIFNNSSSHLVVHCPKCNEKTYSVGERFCYLCNNEKSLTCAICGKMIELDDISIWDKSGKCKACSSVSGDAAQNR